MKIRKFNESVNEISTDRVDEILKELKEVLNTITDSESKVVSLSNELSNFRSEGDKNDQIDDIVIKLDQTKSKIDELGEYMTEINNLLESYKKDGRKFLY